jgi:hypothetical protein
VLFFEDVGVDGDIAYDLEFVNVVKWRVGGTKCSGKRVDFRNILGSFV